MSGMQVTETYRVGSTTRNRRRDLRNGDAVSITRCVEGGLHIETSFGDSFPGNVEETYWSPEPDVLCVRSTIFVGDRHRGAQKSASTLQVRAHAHTRARARVCVCMWHAAGLAWGVQHGASCIIHVMGRMQSHARPRSQHCMPAGHKSCAMCWMLSLHTTWRHCRCAQVYHRKNMSKSDFLKQSEKRNGNAMDIVKQFGMPAW